MTLYSQLLTMAARASKYLRELLKFSNYQNSGKFKLLERPNLKADNFFDIYIQFTVPEEIL